MTERDLPSLDLMLKRLHLANARRIWRDLVQRAEQERMTYEAFLRTLIEEEIACRKGTRLRRTVHAAAFPFLKTIEEFDFTFQSSLRLATMGSFLSPDFVTEGRSVILHGKTGRGKTHLAVAMAYRAIQNGFEARFVTAASLIDDLSDASRRGALRAALAEYVRPHVLIVDEVGYLTYGNDAANVLFHVVNERHVRKRAMIFTTNKEPERWGDVLHDDDLAATIVDRVLERGRLLRLDGPSGRTRHLPPGEKPADPSAHPVIFSGKGRTEFSEPTFKLQAYRFAAWVVSSGATVPFGAFETYEPGLMPSTSGTQLPAYGKLFFADAISQITEKKGGIVSTRTVRPGESVTVLSSLHSVPGGIASYAKLRPTLRGTTLVECHYEHDEGMTGIHAGEIFGSFSTDEFPYNTRGWSDTEVGTK